MKKYLYTSAMALTFLASSNTQADPGPFQTIKPHEVYIAGGVLLVTGVLTGVGLTLLIKKLMKK